MSSNKMATKSDLQEMYSRILPYLGGSADAGFTPVGTVISVMSTHAPANYLICDGTVYNIADYPELANHFLNEFGSKNKFGGNGTTTFAVPDLRGEFLRGTGTNSHANQGNGSAVGTHQDATIIPYLVSWHGTTPQSGIMGASESDLDVKNPDKAWKRSSGTLSWAKASSFTSGTTGMTNDSFITRPTNTSILFCIATKNIYLNPSNDYSTDEKVIGTWINGKTLYQRTIVDTMPETTTAGTWEQKNVALGISDLDMFINSYGLLDNPASDSNSYIQLPFISGSSGGFWFLYKYSAVMNSPYINLRNSNPPWSNKPCYITIQYTKTTD